MTDTSNDGELDLLAVLPRLSQLGTVLNRSRLIDRATESAGLGLDRPGLGVLVTLQTGGGPLRVGEIARRMQVVGPHVTRHVNELERRGLVQRVADPDDRRARLVELTPAGSEAVGRYMQTVLSTLGEALAGWSPEDRRTFGRLLDRFATDLTTRLSTLDD
ncbi:MarR family transcriptional regulator [Actinoplanes philippinensis]|uniref:DNA-binding transcriptional regulator, MarR family n=1 Tax=Actinoplanes philippinensis TaxID=35752 RepID=A0A1I2HLW5_9ACTN|nr:MarR family transcriptional regulator [Actinoplanes philippinensis]GIE74077.1 MarR family transcriptional regulator [Actinoplanes philippinensis]SFF30260.1 DNA-binding transcriptional regulator, MarR family [Actinoplanes philippinensis]